MCKVVRKQPEGKRWHKHQYYLFNSERSAAKKMRDEVLAWLNKHVKGKGVSFHRAQWNWTMYVNCGKRKKNAKASWFVSIPPQHDKDETFNDFYVYFKKRKDALKFEESFLK